MTYRQALHELREYFEQKRNRFLRKKLDATDPVEARILMAEADAYNHAMEMVARYISDVAKHPDHDINRLIDDDTGGPILTRGGSVIRSAR